MKLIQKRSYFNTNTKSLFSTIMLIQIEFHVCMIYLLETTKKETLKY